MQQREEGREENKKIQKQRKIKKSALSWQLSWSLDFQLVILFLLFYVTIYIILVCVIVTFIQDMRIIKISIETEDLQKKYSSSKEFDGQERIEETMSEMAANCCNQIEIYSMAEVSQMYPFLIGVYEKQEMELNNLVYKKIGDKYSRDCGWPRRP